METQSYYGEDLIAGEIKTAIKVVTAGAYYKGQLLGRNDSTNEYGAYDDGASNGLQNVKAVVVEDRTLSASGQLTAYVTGSELNGAGIVDANGNKLTITHVITESAQDAGIIIR